MATVYKIAFTVVSLLLGDSVTDLFWMSSFIATSRLVYNGGYIQNRLQLFSLPEILSFVRVYLVTTVSLNLD